MTLKAADHLAEVIGLKNDIVHKVFKCPECGIEVTISRYQVEGELDIMCTRCNAKWRIQGEDVLDRNDSHREFMGYRVFVKLDESQRGASIPDDRPANAEGVTPAQAEARAKAAAAAAAKARAEAAKKQEGEEKAEEKNPGGGEGA